MSGRCVIEIGGNDWPTFVYNEHEEENERINNFFKQYGIWDYHFLAKLKMGPKWSISPKFIDALIVEAKQSFDRVEIVTREEKPPEVIKPPEEKKPNPKLNSLFDDDD